MQKKFKISTNKHQEVIDITSQVEKIVSESEIENGLCLVFTPHATAGIIINENADPNIREDILTALNKIIPEHAGWKHDKIDNNAAAHIKASILGPSEIIAIENNELVLGTWQNIGFVELDGPRSRNIIVKIIG